VWEKVVVNLNSRPRLALPAARKFLQADRAGNEEVSVFVNDENLRN
jgi:hypothetical protein